MPARSTTRITASVRPCSGIQAATTMTRAKAEGGDDDDKVAGPPDMELSFNVGVQFGLTDVTSDGALKFQGSLAW